MSGKTNFSLFDSSQSNSPFLFVRKITAFLIKRDESIKQFQNSFSTSDKMKLWVSAAYNKILIKYISITLAIHITFSFSAFLSLSPSTVLQILSFYLLSMSGFWVAFLTAPARCVIEAHRVLCWSRVKPFFQTSPFLYSLNTAAIEKHCTISLLFQWILISLKIKNKILYLTYKGLLLLNILRISSGMDKRSYKSLCGFNSVG